MSRNDLEDDAGDVLADLDKMVNAEGLEDPDGMLEAGDPDDDAGDPDDDAGDPDDDAGDPDDDAGDPDDDTGAPSPILAMIGVTLTARARAVVNKPAELAKLTASINAQLKKRGKKPITAAQLKAAVKPPVKRPAIHAPAPVKRPVFSTPKKPPSWAQARTKEQMEARRRTVADFGRFLGGRAPATIEMGYLYGLGEFTFNAVSTADANRSFLIAEPTTSSATFFTESIGEPTTRLGNVHTATASDTNLRRLGKLSYHDMVMLIEYIELVPRGMRIKYSNDDASAAYGNSTIQEVLKGNGYIHDDAGFVLPKEFYRDNDGYNELERALIAAGVVRFKRTQYEAGDNLYDRDIFIDTFRNLDEHRRSLKDTSGGSNTLERYHYPAGPGVSPGLKEGFLWQLDASRPENGEFQALLKTDEQVIIPFKPVAIGSSGQATPEKVGLYYECRVWGMTVRPQNAQMRPLVGQKR